MQEEPYQVILRFPCSRFLRTGECNSLLFTCLVLLDRFDKFRDVTQQHVLHVDTGTNIIWGLYSFLSLHVLDSFSWMTYVEIVQMVRIAQIVRIRASRI